MASRGRKTIGSSKAKPSPVKKSAKEKAKGGLVGAGKALLGKVTGGTKGKSGVRGKHLTAKLILKRAYERRARHQIRMGNLGAARRTLRKKQTVV